ncbi:MAG: phycobilisome linker polypeptide [Hormoscilla sp.]
MANVRCYKSSDDDSRMVEIEVTGLCRQDIIRASNYRVKVPYRRLSQKMQEIGRIGGKIKGVRMISSSLELSPPSAEPASSAPGSSETAGSETVGSETSTKASKDATLATHAEVKPVRSKRKSVEAKKKDTKKTSKLKKLKRKQKSKK